MGPLLLRKVREGDELRLDGDRVYAGDHLVGVGIRQSTATIPGTSVPMTLIEFKGGPVKKALSGRTQEPVAARTPSR